MTARGKGFVVWFTGLPAAGKTTIAQRVLDELQHAAIPVELLDGDVTRQTLCRDLGFSREDRAQNIERVGHIAALLSKHGIGVLAAFVSPYRRERNLVRSWSTNFLEAYVSTPLAVCERRDPKGMYARARRGEIPNFTGISDPYEPPERPDIELPADRLSVEACTARVLHELARRGLLRESPGPKAPEAARAPRPSDAHRPR